MTHPSEPSPNPAAASPVQLNLDTQGLAETYDRLGYRQFDHGKLLIADLEVLPGHRVLDIGSGTGLLGEYVADQVGPGGLVVGIDPLPYRIAVARRRTAGNFRVQVGRAEDLSTFPAASFDITYFNSVFHWISDKPAALREAARVLKSSGRLGISTAAREQPHDLEKLFAAAFGAESRLGLAIPHKVNSGELAGLFADAGLATARLEIRTLTDRFADVDEVLAFNISSSFGNAFAGLDQAGRERVREILDRALDRYRLEDGSIRLQRHLIFAVARKA